MKPSWDDAPNWAEWLACDRDHEWFWWEKKPSRVRWGWAYGDNSGRVELAIKSDCGMGWHIEPRP